MLKNYKITIFIDNGYSKDQKIILTDVARISFEKSHTLFFGDKDPEDLIFAISNSTPHTINAVVDKSKDIKYTLEDY